MLMPDDPIAFMDVLLGVILRHRIPYRIEPFELQELKDQLQESRTQRIINLNILSSITRVPYQGVQRYKTIHV